nr:hypothetical protein [Dickeya dianthicola]
MADSSIKEVVSAVQHVADIMVEISTATSEQGKGISYINESIVQIDSITQQNMALVQQAVAAANELELQAQRLKESVAYFNTDGAGHSRDTLTISHTA